MKLSEFIQISERYAKSSNVERDAKLDDFSNYRVTGRVQDILGQIIKGISQPSAGRAFSITGPYGTGKSSFAIFLRSLLAPTNGSQYKNALDTLIDANPKLGEGIANAREIFSASSGLNPVMAFATAKMEPLAETMRRALVNGLSESGQERFADQVLVLEALKTDLVDVPALQRVIENVAKETPIFFLIDEFGKNLETFAESRSAGDPYLLQQIAESSQGANALPIFIITLQHLAFEEYVSDAAESRRREWSKIQGRFHDIGFVESAEQTQALVTGVISESAEAPYELIEAWYKKHLKVFSPVVSYELARAVYPLHPLVLAVLPDLCNRYGQNERTLFSFLAGSEPKSLPALIEELEVNENSLPFVALDALYDYFVASASSFIGASSSASRWIEIETRIRDTVGITILETKVLKSIGLLNLVSAGGATRASTELLLTAGLSNQGYEYSRKELEDALASLESSGIITYRKFSEEWRIWSGSDFDLRRYINFARERGQFLDTYTLLEGQLQLDPVIAGRHSQAMGILRIFPQFLYSETKDYTLAMGAFSDPDGLILLATEAISEIKNLPTNGRPTILGVARNPEYLRERALDVYAINGALEELKKRSSDLVAENELRERLSLAKTMLFTEAAHQWDTRNSDWFEIGSDNSLTKLNESRNLSELLSTVCDSSYTHTPRVANEMIARRELTSQGSKARRVLVEHLLKFSDKERLTLLGYGPERAIFEAIFYSSGLHTFDKKSFLWKISEPTELKWLGVWRELKKIVDESRFEKINLNMFGEALKRPPFGLKDGIIWLLVWTFLQAHSKDIALYEYGTLVLELDDAIAERLLKNPGVFSIRQTGVNEGDRREFISRLAHQFKMKDGLDTSFLSAAKSLFNIFKNLPEFTKNTDSEYHLSDVARKVRDSFLSATEPDQLMFEVIPVALGFDPIKPKQRLLTEPEFQSRINSLARCIMEIQGCYPELLSKIEKKFCVDLGFSGELSQIRSQAFDLASNLPASGLSRELENLKIAFLNVVSDDVRWLENAAMVLTKNPAKSWNDDGLNVFSQKLTFIRQELRNVRRMEFLAGAGGSSSLRSLTYLGRNGERIEEIVNIGNLRTNSGVLEAIANLKQVAGIDITLGGQDVNLLLAALILEQNVLEDGDNSSTNSGDTNE